jgi:dolichol-phosphate mannosyltransferase
VTRAWIVIPTYNEAENLPSLVAAVRTAMASGGSGVDCSILIVDDSSPDGTGHIADALAAAHGGVHVLHRPDKAGLAGAYIAGFRLALAAGADYVLEMDADFSPDPGDLPRLLAAARAGADVVLGSRYVRGEASTAGHGTGGSCRERAASTRAPRWPHRSVT